jgi:hypothetical protein
MSLNSSGVGFAIGSIAAVWLIVMGVDAFEVDTPWVRHEIVGRYKAILEAARSQQPNPDQYDIAFLGDSMVASYPPKFRIPRTLEISLNQHSRATKQRTRRAGTRTRYRVVSFAQDGAGIFDHYFMVDIISDVEPDLVILPFNLVNPSYSFQMAFSRPEFSGWIDLERLGPTLMRPLHWGGITVDQILFYFGVTKIGGFDLLTNLARYQGKFSVARDMLTQEVAYIGERGRSAEQQLQRAQYFANGESHKNRDYPNRHNEHSQELVMGLSLAGLPANHPTLEMLGATVRDFHAKGIRVLVYISPINYEHMQRLGLYDEERFAETLRNVQAAAEDDGATYLEISKSLEDKWFRDRHGHLTYEGRERGQAELAKLLAPAVLKVARERGRGLH